MPEHRESSNRFGFLKTERAATIGSLLTIPRDTTNSQLFFRCVFDGMTGITMIHSIRINDPTNVLIALVLLAGVRVGHLKLNQMFAN